ncbi:MAG: crotonase/enoyl-CoA hydratase family protein [Saprospiraceae bacterium]|nr:crotonase/enoyl-CoA hydratase family protein [Bacteroidia bacterium]NNL93052.1 crotonase/enoyl-CoA hydratase family protein [Saprospiraceae bacterium]
MECCYKYFNVELSDYIAEVIFNRPDKANSLHVPAWEELKEVFDDLSNNDKARAIILRGEGKHFCAGMDLQALMSVPAGSDSNCEARKRLHIRKFIIKIQEIITSIEDCRKPVIAAVHKACVGGGLNIITACDMRYCTDDAFFSIKETDLGLVADIGVLQRMPDMINPGIMTELAFTGRQFNGPEAKEIGLVTESFDTQESMLNHVRDLAKTISEKSPLVMQGIKEMLLYKRDHSTQDAMQYMASWNAAMLMSKDLYESFEAYMAKRKPVY